MECTVCELHAESTFKVEGMDCHEEVALIERRFRSLAGLEDFNADVMGRRMHVRYDAAKLSAGAIVAAIADAGMSAWLEHEEPVAPALATRGWRRVLLTLSTATFLAGLAAEFGLSAQTAAIVLYACATAAGVPLTAGKAWRALRAGSVDINVLMLVAATGAVVLGQWSEGAAVVLLFAVAQALEARTLEGARNAVRALMELTPAEALIVDASGERSVPVESVRVGMQIVIKPGQKIPLDGTVVAGTSAVNQASVTGESMPADKKPGDEVFAGTLNGRGALEVTVTKLRRDTTLARIIHMVERAQAQRAPAEQFVDRFARVYTPLVIALGFATAVLPPLLGYDWRIWVYRSLVLLVVSCPCALVISTPVSVVAALAGAARRGVLIKGGAHLERLARVRCVAFDKTGTLTTGVPHVVRAVPINGTTEPVLVALAAAVERRSTHPMAKAIIERAQAIGAPVYAGSDVRAIDGRGAEGVVDGSRILVGNHRLFEELAVCSPDAHALLEAFGAEGMTPVLVARDARLIGVLAVADSPRHGGRATVDRLRAHGVESIVMLTGDTAATAMRLAAEVGIGDVRADLLPEGKVDAVHQLRRQFGTVAMVGDGVNDAPALASADVGIVMGAAASDAALETADVALMADDLLKIPYAVRLSRATVRNIRANLAIALVLKGAFVVAAVAGVATLWMAVLADTGASVLVIANALTLLRAE
jgi:Cd2+/Zn2+-exporting ATPase